jgi:putative tryptophan/tyrosine transport system substrate-binding protein
MQFRQLRRREVITFIGCAAAAWPLAARAQQPERMRRIGVLMGDSSGQPYLTAFMQSLRTLGWIEGQNVHIDVRWNADTGRAQAIAAELVGRAPDAILSVFTLNLMALQQATRSVPIVFVQVSDPVSQGFIASLSQPGGNLTGFTNFEFSIGGKWLELLKQIAPELKRVAVMFNPERSPQSQYYLRAIESAAQSFGAQVVVAPVRSVAEIESRIESLSGQPAGLILPTDGFTMTHQRLIAYLGIRHRLPAVTGNSNNFEPSGILLYYGSNANLVEHYRQAAVYIDRILKGAKPGEMPVQLSTSFRLVINLTTAKALGLDVPPPLLARADEVIE